MDEVKDHLLKRPPKAPATTGAFYFFSHTHNPTISFRYIPEKLK
tara:strand:+ start:93 stop:224 length:132 start_codon:yes stop_codon:yes gene_type:complete